MSKLTLGFEHYLRNEVKRFRQLFADQNASYLSISITADGPVDHGDMLIKFQIGESSYGGESVQGSNLDACAAEFFRRKGWKRHNEYVALPYFEPED